MQLFKKSVQDAAATNVAYIRLSGQLYAPVAKSCVYSLNRQQVRKKMIEIHAWITLRYDDYDTEEEYQRKFIAHFKQYLQANYDWLLQEDYCKLIVYNGLDCFSLHTQHNHKGKFYALKIFEWVAKEGKGSYGMLYFHDEEDDSLHNEFQVYVLKRGKLYKQADKFLSPYFSEVEKVYDDLNPPKD
ncbi:Imm7 family immunity protein [Rhodocytophaga aerolata]|uniref:Imm7 family immunity protein n=1 Tax=Rhodocytophaga aerolata TaxID=455078 RepID=A0ABT8R6P5_9BACT|nr:Imm7 family immunity protein [Rhodocytophaga aerolata]MDO1447341.1 Imm7 family immunity protein [Rhodocytophaga aerolata]